MEKAFFAILLILTACAPVADSVPTPQVLSVYATPATQPWLPEVYSCAKQQSVVIRLSASESAADIRLRLGEPETLTTPAYQIDSEDLLVVTHPESPLQNLTIDQVRELFAQGQADVQLWVFSSGEDVQEVFEREIMHGIKVNSLAQLAASPQQMSDTLNKDSHAVGPLPRRWKAGAVREVFTLPNIPVLALTATEPQGVTQELMACLQQKTAP